VKTSDKLKIEAQEEENDFRALALYTKSMREARLERWEEGDYKNKLEAKDCIIIPFNGSKVTIDTQTELFGIIDYFPKANKILIRKKNKWCEQGLKWINQNLIKDGL
jgi:hypothetical protein